LKNVNFEKDSISKAALQKTIVSSSSSVQALFSSDSVSAVKSIILLKFTEDYYVSNPN